MSRCRFAALFSVMIFICSAAFAAPEDVANLVPEDVLVFAQCDSLSDLLSRADALGAEVRQDFPANFLSESVSTMLADQGIDGVDLDGSIGVVVLNPKQFPGVPMAFVIVRNARVFTVPECGWD